MSYTRSRGSTSYTTRTRTKEPEVELEEGIPKCSGHNRRCKEFTAGPKTKNPGRKFYTCPLGQSDPQRCSFFKWADDLPSTSTSTGGGQKLGGPSAILERVNERYGSTAAQAQTLGQSPQSRYGKPAMTNNLTPTTNRTVVPMTPETHSKDRTSASEQDGPESGATDEIDWDKVDTESLERDAIASTPGSSQRMTGSFEGRNETWTDTTTLQDKFLSVAAQTPSRGDRLAGKRKRDDEDDVDVTPKRPVIDAAENPFLSPGRLASPVHHALSPSVSSFEQLSAHLHRQDRLIRAGETAKEGFRKTIQKQKEQIEALEKRIKELEGR